MEKTDLTKLYKSYYRAGNRPEIITLEPANYLSVRGKGDPSGAAFQLGISALYGTAYTLKFICKSRGQDFAVAKLEGQWWFDEKKYPGKTISTSVTDVPRSEWEYRLLIRIPDFIREAEAIKAAETALSKGKVPAGSKVEFFSMHEGKAVQMMHTGPFSDEPASLLEMDVFMKAQKLERNGLHHEIYLSDFRKTSPEKLKTILREPVRQISF